MNLGWQIRQICLILLKGLLFTPSTKTWAQNVLNLDLRHFKIKFKKLNFDTFKGFLIFTELGKWGKFGRKIGQILPPQLEFQKTQIALFSTQRRIQWLTFEIVHEIQPLTPCTCVWVVQPDERDLRSWMIGPVFKNTLSYVTKDLIFGRTQSRSCWQVLL